MHILLCITNNLYNKMWGFIKLTLSLFLSICVSVVQTKQAADRPIHQNPPPTVSQSASIATNYHNIHVLNNNIIK